MKRCSNIVLILFSFVLILAVSACGKMSEPSPIEGSGYPHTYPRR